MTHIHHFFSRDINESTALVELSGDEAHHALRVARVRPGDVVSISDGNGLEIAGEVASCDKRTAVVCATQAIRHAPPSVRVTVAVGGLHRDKAQEYVVRRAAELGAHRVCFWDADHSQRKIDRSDRWEKTAIEACKQCCRFFLPRIDTAPSLASFLADHDGPCIIGSLLEDPAAPPPTVPRGDSLALLVGPEGDFSAQEMEAARSAGAIAVSLGDTIYRSEVAASLLMTLVAYKLGGLGPGFSFGQNGAA